MLAHPIDILLTVLLALAGPFMRPTIARCPRAPGWMLNGVHPDGRFSCLHFSVVESDAPADAEIDRRVYCDAASIPINIDGVTVTCQTRH